MIERITGIVLDTVKHSDRHNVVTLFTRERGRMSFLSPAGKGKSGLMRNARLMPLSVVTADINIHANRELQVLPTPQRAAVWHDLYFNPVKSSVAIFLSEFLNAYLRHSEADSNEWDFIFRSVESLDSARRGMANLHLAFLIGLLPFAGIEPDLSGAGEGRWFDMRGGCFTPFPPPHGDSLRPEEARLLPLLSRMTAANSRAFRFSAAQRRRLLAGLLQYYSVHFPGLANLKSPSILTEVFASPGGGE